MRIASFFYRPRRRPKRRRLCVSSLKIDETYPDSQFAINNYHLFRNDLVEGGGGLMAYFSSVLPSKHLKQPKVFKTIEVLLIQSIFGAKDVIMMGIYRSQKVTGNNYYVTLEKEPHEICSWISLQKQFILIMGDMNLNKLRPGDKEGKILCDLEEVNGLECLIKEPTRITENSSTLLDVILTNKQELFRESSSCMVQFCTNLGLWLAIWALILMQMNTSPGTKMSDPNPANRWPEPPPDDVTWPWWRHPSNPKPSSPN